MQQALLILTSLGLYSLSLLHDIDNLYSSETQQDAQLSQRDRAAGCVIVFAKSRKLELVDYILRTL